MRDDKIIGFIEQCYKLYEQKLYQLAFRILHDECMAEDAVQEAFLKLMKSGVYFETVDGDDCKRYLIQVIKNASITIYNKRKKECENYCLQGERELDLVAEQNDDFSKLDEKLKARSLLERLPAKYLKVVECMVFEELSVRETANKLMISESNVRKRYERAKRKLKILYDNAM